MSRDQDLVGSQTRSAPQRYSCCLGPTRLVLASSRSCSAVFACTLACIVAPHNLFPFTADNALSGCMRWQWHLPSHYKHGALLDKRLACILPFQPQEYMRCM